MLFCAISQVEIDEIDFAQRRDKGTLSGLSVKQLKTFLYHRQELLSGTKPELVERVTQCLDADPSQAASDAAGASALEPPSEPHANGVSPAHAAAGGSSGGESKGGGSISDAPLSMFDPEASSTDAQDDLLIDEVFSSI